MLLIRILPLLALLGAATASFDSAMLEIHNMYRQKEVKEEGAKNMATLTYSQKLKAKAQAWANSCRWKHSPPETPWIGENLAMSGPANPDLEAEAKSSVKRWYEEKKDYSYDSNRSINGKAVGHYTQVVWAKTKEVGCGYKLCKGGDFDGEWNYVVCNYGPGGNFNGEKPYEKGSGGNSGGDKGNSGGDQGKNGGDQGNNEGDQGNNGGGQVDKAGNQGNDGKKPGTQGGKGTKPCPNCSDGTCSSCRGNKPSRNGRKMVAYANAVARRIQKIKDLLANKLNGNTSSKYGRLAVVYVYLLDKFLGRMLDAMEQV